jgi:hypothetical protein
LDLYFRGPWVPGKAIPVMTTTDKKTIVDILIDNDQIPVYMEILNCCMEFYAGPNATLPEEDKRFWTKAIEHQKELLTGSLKNDEGYLILMGEDDFKILHALFNSASETFYCPIRRLLNGYAEVFHKLPKDNPIVLSYEKIDAPNVFTIATRNLDSKIEICSNLTNYINRIYESMEENNS